MYETGSFKSERVITRVAAALGLLAWTHAASAGGESTPKCATVFFTGVAVGESPSNLAAIDHATNLDDLLARHPLVCGPNALTQTYTCGGAARFTHHVGFVVNWGHGAFWIITPVDLTVGRRDTLLFIRRKDAECRGGSPPADNMADNMMSFFRSGYGDPGGASGK